MLKMDKKDINKSLLNAVITGNLKRIRQYLDQGAALVSSKHGDCALHLAAWKGHLDIVKFLILEQKFNPNVKDTNGNTPLNLTASNGHLKVVQWLLERQDIDKNEGNEDGNTPLHEASFNGYLGIIESFLESTDVNPNIKNKYGQSPLHFAAVNGNVEIVQSFLGRTDIVANEPDEDWDTPLHLAALHVHYDIVQLFLKRTDINPKARNRFNETPFDVVKEKSSDSKETKQDKNEVKELLKIYQLGLPAELKALDKASANKVISLLKKTWYSHFEALVMLVGEQGTGKTTIARYLIGKGPTRVRKSTNGIGLYTGLSYIDQEVDKWLKGKQDFSKSDVIISRYLRPFDDENSSMRMSIDSSNLPGCVGTYTTFVQNNEGLGCSENSLVFDVSEVKYERPIQAKEITSIITAAGEETIECNNHISRHEDQRTTNTLTQIIPEQTERNNESKCDLISRQDDFVNKRPVTDDDQYKDADYKQSKLDDTFALDSQPVDSLDNGQFADVSPCPDDQTGGHVGNIQLSNSRYNQDSQHRDSNDNRLMSVVSLNPDDHIKDSQNIRPAANVFSDTGMQHGDLHNIRPLENARYDVDKPHCNPNDKVPGASECLDLEKQQENFHVRPIQNVPYNLGEQQGVSDEERPVTSVTFDLDEHKISSNADKPISIKSVNSNRKASEFYETTRDPHNLSDDFDYLDATFQDKLNESKQNRVGRFGQGSTKLIMRNYSGSENIPENIVNVDKANMNKSEDGDNKKSELTTSTETLTNPKTVSTLKKIFGVSKDVKEVKVSITKAKHLKVYLKVHRKRLLEKPICPVVIWDFGGQDIFYSTHQIFLSYRAVYLIILDGSRNLDDPCPFTQYLPGKSGQKTARDYLRFWCNTIVTYCKESSNEFPKILIVFTHKDKMKPDEVENRRKLLFKDVSNMFHGSQVMPHLVIGDNIFVNATDKKDPEMHTIQSSIIREVYIHPTQGQKLPRCFIRLELKFERLIKRKTAVLTLDQLQRINVKHPTEQLSNSELKLFLRFQHAFGKIVYFEEPGLDQHIILQPAFLIDAFKSIITDKSFYKGNKQREEIWDTMSQTGVISKAHISKIWRKRKYRKFKHDMNYFLAVMTRLDIIIEPRRYDSNHNRIPTDFYYVASMVQTKDETGYLQSQTLIQRNIAIAFHAPSLIIPPALSFRFIAYWLSIWDVKKDGDKDMLFHRSAVFTIDSSLEAYILCEDETIIIRLVHARNRVLIMSDLACSIGECLASTLQQISQLYTKTSSEKCIADNTTFEMKLCCSASDDPCFISKEDLQNIDSIWICPKHEIGHEKLLLSSWFTRKEETLECSSNCPVTNEELLNEVPSVLYLRRLSLLYDLNETRELVTRLGLPYSEWSDLFQLETEPEILKFKALWSCHEYSTLTFGKIKDAVETGNIQNKHTLCKAFKDKYVDLDTEQEEWNLVPTDEDIDNMAPLIGNKSLQFLVELGMNFQTWLEINHRQQERDLVKLNRDILNEWKSKFCKTNNVRPTMRKIAQAYKNIGKDVKVIMNTLFS